MSALWGGTFVAVKEGLADSSPLLFVGLRFLLATLACLPLQPSPREWKRVLRVGVPLGAALGAGYATQTLGLLTTTPARSAFLTGLNSALVPLWALLLLRRRPPRGALAGLTLAVPGLWLLTAPGTVGLGPGEWWTLGCAFVYALWVVLLSHWAPGRDAGALLVVQLATTAVLCLTTGAAVEDLRFSLTPKLAWALLGTSLLATAGTTWLQVRYQPRLDPSRAAMIYATEPAFAAIFALLWGEAIPLASWLGGGLIVAGTVLSEWDTARGVRRLRVPKMAKERS